MRDTSILSRYSPLGVPWTGLPNARGSSIVCSDSPLRFGACGESATVRLGLSGQRLGLCLDSTCWGGAWCVPVEDERLIVSGWEWCDFDGGE